MAADAEKELDVQLSRQVSRFGAGLNTAGDAMQFCSRPCSTSSLQKAAAESALLPNVAVDGDSAARAAFLMLLTDAHSSASSSLRFGKDQRAWPRIKPLVGSPPFHFLAAERRGHAQRERGFARGRINMTYDIGGRTAATGQFGPGQLVDEHTREYRIAPRQTASTDPLPGGEYFRSQQRDMVLASAREKAQLQAEEGALHFGLQEATLLSATGRDNSGAGDEQSPQRARAQEAHPDPSACKGVVAAGGQGGSTAAILVGF